jgi:hypothetical protein
MSVLTTWPNPLDCLSNKASKIPKAHMRPPPPKSARRLSGNVGLALSPGNIWESVGRNAYFWDDTTAKMTYGENSAEREIVDIVACW